MLPGVAFMVSLKIMHIILVKVMINLNELASGKYDLCYPFLYVRNKAGAMNYEKPALISFVLVAQ